MIIGLFLKNIKSYEKTSFIPIVRNSRPYSFFIGENGVGKSSILEALDIYFNNKKEWNINEKCKSKDDVLISPVFLIKKDKINFSGLEKDYLENISESFLSWEIEKTANIKSNDWVIDFHNFIYGLKKINDLSEYYLFLSTKFYEERNQNIFFTFDSFIKSSIVDFNDKILKKLFTRIDALYSYIYIPVETPIEEVLKMETDEMQKLLNEDVLKVTDNILRDKTIIENGKKINIVDKINFKLDEFMDKINESISKIDSTYSYKDGGIYKRNLKPAHIREQIFKAYFSIRTLYKDKKDIAQLSSGEKRKALIDIATAFLVQEGNREKDVVLAIDEPETSMHMKKMFNQFKQLEALTINNNIQFIGTTHWYGFLPVTEYGNLNHISLGENKINIKNFDFFNLFENNSLFPDDIEMKSFFELVTSILSSIKSSSFNKWIICEGSDDKKYLEYYLKYSGNENLIILPVSGCGNVRKLYNLIYAFLSEKDRISIKGKILCLIDTDIGTVSLNNKASEKDKIIFIRRLQSYNNFIKLEKITNNSQKHSQTEVEDCLEPEKYYESLFDVLENTDYMKIFKSYKLNKNCKISKIKNIDEESLLIFDEKGGDIKHVNQFTSLLKYLETDEVKQKICSSYIKQKDAVYLPSWISEIINLMELEKVDLSIKRPIDEEKVEIKELLPDFFYDWEELDSDNIFKFKNFVEENNNNILVSDYFNKRLLKLVSKPALINILIQNRITLNISVSFILDNIEEIKKTSLGSNFIRLLCISSNFSDTDLKLITSIVHSDEASSNDADLNALYFLLYVVVKLNDLDKIEKIFENRNIISVLNSIYTISYYSYFRKYIKIGYKFNNFIQLGNNFLTSTSMLPFSDLYIKMLIKCDLYEFVLNEDKKGSFKNKIEAYKENPIEQDRSFDDIFEDLFLKLKN